MSTAQPQIDERLLASLLREQRPAPPALDADLAAQFAKAVMRELQAQQAAPGATPEPTKPRKRARTAIFDSVVLAILVFVTLAVLYRAFGPFSVAIDPPALSQATSIAAPTSGTAGEPAQQQPAVVNIYLATPAPAPEPTAVPPAPGAPDFPASFRASPDNGAYLTCFNPAGCNPSGAPQSSGGPPQAVIEAVRQARVTPQDFHQAVDNSAFVGCLVPGGCNPSPAQPALPAPGTPGFVGSFR